LIWRRKLWEWHTGWLGLALSLASAFLITNGMKNLFGKPRPDLISRCQPDLANIAKYTLKGFTSPIADFHVVYAGICQQTDKSLLDDGFRSFPSGHASFSAAGLIYLSLFLASKLAITLPFLASNSDEAHLSAFPSRAERKAMASGDHLEEPSGHNDAVIAARNQAAAPPVYLLLIAALPTFASIYIASTRYSDFRHHGFDILSGYFIGAITSIFAFRYYHLPISAGAGWSWGPRSRDRSWWAGVGVGSYVGSNKSTEADMHERCEVDLEPGVNRKETTNDVGPVSGGSERAV
jgi:membrane-associated phospholipid phosphatase